ncbi:MAG: hypothetical protein KJO98_12065 [Rhodothermia bacterium]|nr:hypothetical protein [Rhodothermia bacterium]
MKHFCTSVLLIVLCSAGCKPAVWEDVDSGAEGSPLTDATFRPLGNFDVAGSESYKGHHPAATSARLELLDSVMDRVDEIRDALNSDGTWQVRQRRILEIMTEPDVSEPEAWFVDQIGSSMVLERIGPPAGRDPVTFAEKSVAAHFLNVLVARRSPNAPLIADALEITWDLWTPEGARSIAMTAADNAKTYLEACTDCVDSESKSSVAGRDRESRLIAEGRVRLLQLANTGPPPRATL